MKLVVVGGVAAGASVAARARRLDEDAEIVVLERSHHVSFANCGLPYHIGEVITKRDRLILQTPETLHERLNIDVRVGSEVRSIDREARTVQVVELDTGREYTESYDKLALCMGARAVRPPMAGIGLPGVHVLRRIGDMDQIKEIVDAAVAKARIEVQAGRRNRKDPTLRTVVVGAGYIGLEMAENLRDRGASVDVVEMADQILPPLDKEMSISVERHLRAHGVTVHLGAAVAAFSPRKEGALNVELKNNVVLPADLVILSAGVRPRTDIAVAAGIELGPRGGIKVDTHQRTNDPNVWAAGDVVETPHTTLPGSHLVPLAGPANRQARVAAENICGRDTTYDSTQGTSVVKVFDMVAGGTGASVRQLQAAGLPYRAVHVHPTGHAGYYPGTSMLHLKVLFDPESGRLLGGQCAGFEGVDKRLDVLAAVIRMGGTVFDLEKMELAYAPPFGSAKDPVNMAGFVAANTILGDVKLWYAEDYPAVTEGARIIDVREPEEFDIWHIPGAENVPVGTIRQAIEDFDRSTPVRLYCAVGFRSYLAYRVLAQKGFDDVSLLSGGSTTFRFWHDVEPEKTDAPAPITPYAERDSLPSLASGITIDLDVTGLACPGPIMKLTERMRDLNPGDEITAHVSDAGFATDAPAWARRNGHSLVDIEPEGPGFRATFRKGGAAPTPAPQAQPPARARNSFVVFSGDLDKLVAAFIIANGALAMGNDVSMFFTFWGLNALRDPDAPKRDMKAMEKVMAKMMPSGPDALPLSQMNMGGAGAALIRNTMKQHNVAALPEMIDAAIQGGARIIACTMTMDLLGIERSDLIGGIDFGGVATFLDDAADSQTTLFI